VASEPESIDDLFARFGPAYRWLVTIAGMTASFTMVLTATIVNVAVPDVMGAYGVGQDKAQFLQTSFITTMTASQLLNAWVVGKLGQRNAFVGVLALFLVGAFICGFSPSLDGIIVGRVMQGFAAGIVQPLVMVTLFQVFPSDRRGFAMGIYGVGLMLALGFGPVIGGITSDALNWRYIFFMPIPLVAASLAMGLIFMPSDRPSTPSKRFDWAGYILLCTALFCLMTAIGNGQREGWGSDTIMLTIVIGTVAGVSFVVSQFRAGSSLLEMSLLGNPRFACAIMVAFVFGAGNFAITYAIPVFGQLVQGYSPTVAGFLLLPASLLVVAMLPMTGKLSDRVAPTYPIIGGLLLFVLGAYLLADSDINTGFWAVAVFCIVGRFGMAFISPALMASAMRSVPTDKLNAGSGTINFFRQLGGAMGINTLVVALELRTQFHIDAMTATQTAGNAATRELLARIEGLLSEGGIPLAIQTPLSLNHLGQVLHAQAQTKGFQDGFMLIAIVFIVALIPAYILSQARER
jgi:MFS transporter, DHA2 family, multidrug resistance protein